MTPDDKRLERHRRYNLSSKGRARYARYEAKHPERAERWGPLQRRNRENIGNPGAMPDPWSEDE